MGTLFRLVVLLGLHIASVPLSAYASEHDGIQRLIARLGSASFHVRVAADQRLRAIGTAAVPALQAATTSADREIALRAQEILDALQNENAAIRAGRRNEAARIIAVRLVRELSPEELNRLLFSLVTDRRIGRLHIEAARFIQRFGVDGIGPLTESIAAPLHRTAETNEEGLMALLEAVTDRDTPLSLTLWRLEQMGCEVVPERTLDVLRLQERVMPARRRRE